MAKQEHLQASTCNSCVTLSQRVQSSTQAPKATRKHRKAHVSMWLNPRLCHNPTTQRTPRDQPLCCPQKQYPHYYIEQNIYRCPYYFTLSNHDHLRQRSPYFFFANTFKRECNDAFVIFWWFLGVQLCIVVISNSLQKLFESGT